MLPKNHSLENKQLLIHYVSMQCRVELKLLNLLVLDLVPSVRWNADHFPSCITPGVGSMNANVVFTKAQRAENIGFDLNAYFSSLSTNPGLLLRLRTESEIRNHNCLPASCF